MIQFISCGSQRGTTKFLKEQQCLVFYILVSQICPYVEIHQIVHFKHLQLIIKSIYFNKVVFFKGSQI